MTHIDPLDETTDAPMLLEASEGGERLDKWLAEQLPDRSRSEIRRWIDSGRVLLGGQRPRASYRLSAGDEIALMIPESETYAVDPEPIPLDILYEDADLLVINKPAGMVVHPAVGNWHGTLVNAILHHCPDLEGVGGLQRPGIVHRLDKDTSGVILVAKNDQAHRALQEQFQARTVEKTYLALVYGRLTPGEGEISAPLGRDPQRRKRMAVVPAHRGRHAVTRYRAVAFYSGGPAKDHAANSLTLVACHPLTGRTHQIRVHMAHIRHPIVGDLVYAGRRHSPVDCVRQFLHAETISFRLPGTSASVAFSAPLPEDLATVLAALSIEGVAGFEGASLGQSVPGC